MSTAISKSGTLYIVATPIGNLEDITVRASKILDQVDLIAAEDTRHSARLLKALGISTPLISLHEHNEVAQACAIKEKLHGGQDIALISDAGTPLISDPGYKLVDLIYESGLNVVPIPGPSSVITALCASGISTAAFSFVGFLPAKSGQRRQALMKLKNTSATLILFESPHRIVDSITDMACIFGESRSASFCRELTKQYETIIRGTLGELKGLIENDPNHRRGEIVMVISAADDELMAHQAIDYQTLVAGMLDYMPTKTVSVLLAKHSGLSRKYFYDMALKFKSKS